MVEESPDDGGDGTGTRSLSERLTGLQARRRYGTALATMQGYLGEEAAKQRAKKARQMLAAAGHDKLRCGCPQCTEERNLAWEKQTDEDGKTYHYNTVTGMSQWHAPDVPKQVEVGVPRWMRPGARGAADARIAALTEERPGEQSLGLNWNGVFDVHGRDTIGAPR